MATLDDLRDVFSSVNESITGLAKSIDTQMLSLNSSLTSLVETSNAQKKILEDILNLNKEAKTKFVPTTDTDVVVPPGSNTKGGSGNGKKGKDVADQAEETGLTLLDVFGGLLAGGTALALAFAGFRGWEGKLIGYVKDGLGSVTDSIMSGLKSIKTNIFFAFGLDEAGKVLPNSALDDLLKTPILKTLTTGLSKILAPIKMMGDYMSGLLAGGGGAADDAGKAVGFLTKVGSSVGAFASTVGKILKPIGFLFSAYEAVTSFMSEEGDILDKFVAGIGGFLGDFIGAPLDLLKSIVGWGISKLGFENAAEILEEFSFETLIKDIINGVWDTVRGAAEWVGTLFTDPVTALTDLWNSYYGEGGLVDMLFAPVSMAIDWVTKKFGWRDEDAPPFDLYGIISGFVGNIVSWAGEKLDTISDTLSKGFDTFVNYITTIPDRIKFAAEGMFIEVAARVEKGFIMFGDWIASIPARIKLLALSAINSALSGLPEWAQIVSAEDLAAAQASVNERSESSNQRLEDLDKRTQEKRLDLENRMAASGIYDSAAAATAESNLTGAGQEFNLEDTLAANDRKIRADQAYIEALEERERTRASGGGGSTVIADNSSKTDARSTVSVVNQSIVNAPVNYGGLGDSRMNYPSGIGVSP